MEQSAQDRFVLDALGVDVRRYGSPDEDLDPVMPPPSAGESAGELAPSQPAGPPAGGDPWAAQAALRAAVAKQVAALGVLGAGEAEGFAASLAQIVGTAAGKPAEAAAALAALAPKVQAAFDAARAPRAPTAAETAARRQTAGRVTATAGHGTAADSALVLDELQKMPKAMLDALDGNGTRIKVCRGSVTDYLTDLKGVQPRGWPAGKTWDSVPGLQRPDSKEVVIATIGHDAGTPHVPARGEGHGADNLVIHEAAHGVDFAATPHVSTTKPFTDARDPDKPALSPYESQPDPAGPQETFAESCARFFSRDPSSAQNTPHLHKYWRDSPLSIG